MNLKPLHDNVIVKTVEPEKQTKSGLIIPESARKTLECIVVAVGPGKLSTKGQLIPTQLKPGDRVLRDEYAGNKFIKDDIEYTYMQEAEIIAVLS